MGMRNSMKRYIMAVVSVGMLCLLQGCKQTSTPEQESTPRGEPVLVQDTLMFDEESKTFTLTMHADSTAGAEVTFFLLDGDSILMQNTDGKFSGIQPFDEGYNVKAQVIWEDTTIVTPLTHVLGFVVLREPVEKMLKEEVQQLINSQDKSLARGENEHFIQGFKLSVSDTKQNAPKAMLDVYTLLKNKVWKSVEVTSVEYDDNNLITHVALKPVGETVISEEDYEEEFY